MQMRWTKAAGTALMVKPAILIGTVALVGRLAHSAGFEPCLLTTLADSLSGLTGLSGSDCFGLLIVVLIYSAFRVARSVFELAAHTR
ncbi:exported hypothetical protein [Candidatus Sulfopaludibacter sp. SbA3]|nr:exported hypothetical protein [Candidatus Sulfopaludibacter sp. SbA3]